MKNINKKPDEHETLSKDSSQKVATIIGWVATATGILMYVSYILQIQNNLNGAKGNPIQPLIAGINSILWSVYALSKKPKDWPLLATNLPGILFGFLTFFTAL